MPFDCAYPLDAPGVPLLVAPPDGTLTATQAITLTWQAGAGEMPDGYNLELDGEVLTTTATTSPALLATGVHTWRVRAFNVAGYSDYSGAWTVEVVERRASRYLLSPPDGTLTSTRAITFTWEAGSGGAPAGYELELDGEVLTTTATTSPTLLAAGAHTWRVRAFNVAGYSDYSDAWGLTVAYRVYLPVILRNP